MAYRKRGRRLMIEALERRETPSAGLGGSIHEMVRHPRPISLAGAGMAHYTSGTSGTIAVHGNAYGTLTGTLTATSPTTLTVVVTNHAGTSLDLLVHGSLTRGRHPQFHGVLNAGPGSEVNGVAVTGHGAVNGTLNPATETLTFHINGVLRV